MDTNDAVTKTRTVEVALAMGSPRNSDYNVGSDAEMGDRAESEDEEELRDDLESEGGGGHVDEGEHEGGSDGGEGSDDDDVEEMLVSHSCFDIISWVLMLHAFSRLCSQRCGSIASETYVLTYMP